MSALPYQPPLPEADYLSLERDSEIKNEFIDGIIYAMSGASEAHNLITGNVFASLHGQRKKQYRVYMTDMRVRVAATGAYTYPDVSVACGNISLVEDDPIATLLNPILLVEVLPPSTEAHDKITKLSHYTRLPSLQDYLLIAQDTPRIERYSRQGDSWLYTTIMGLDASVMLESVGSTIALEAVYEEVLPSETGTSLEE